MADPPPFLHEIDAEGRARRIDIAISELASRQHGVVARRQLLEFAGVGAIANRMGRLLHPVHRAVYAVGHPNINRLGRWMAGTLAGGPGAVLSHRSAAHLWGILSVAAMEPEVSVPRGWRPQDGLRIHRTVLRPDEVTSVERITVTGPARTQFDLAAVLPRWRLEKVMNQAEVLGLTDRLSIPDLLDRYPRRRGNAVLRAILRDSERARGVTANEFEDRFAALIDRHGLPRPRFNADVAVAGRFIRADALWQEQRLLVELDGGRAHGTEQAFESDRQRDRILLVEGWRTSRITWKQLREEPGTIAKDIRTLLRAQRPSTL